MTPSIPTQRAARRPEYLADDPFAAPGSVSLDAINPLAARALPEDICRIFGVLPVSFSDGVMTLATTRPDDRLSLRIAHSAVERSGRRVRLRLLRVGENELQPAIDRAFGPVDPGWRIPAVPAPAAPVAPAWETTSPWGRPLVVEPPTAPGPDPVAPAEPPAPAEPLVPPVETPRVEPEPVPADTGSRLGTTLLAAGVVTAEQLEAALETQRRTGDRLGEILVHGDVVEEEALATALAEQLDMWYVDLEGFEPDPAVLALVPVALLDRYRVLPIGLDEDDHLVLAMVDPLDDEAFHALDEATEVPLRSVLAAESAVDRILQRLSADERVDAAVAQLVRRMPDESAYRVLSRGQKRFFIALLVITAILLLLFPIQTIVVFNIGSVAFYLAFSLYRFELIYNALSHDLELPVDDDEVRALDERTLPVYTVLVPLYMEAAVLPKLLGAIAALDYPPTRLDVKILVEEDDDETIETFHSLRPPPHFKLVVVPDALPKTKPKACNYGLLQARGEYVVIFDAEDVPEPDQLKKVLVAFGKASERVVCIQCKLNFYNRDQNILTRWFTTEYSMWFDMYMPGLDATDAPIPLGGTSNHFVTRELLELGAWDPYNVAEDADLGIRLNKAGLRTAIVDSTTFEEANPQIDNWIRQRSRWVKGYIQTWLVHMRHPLGLLRRLGPRRFLSFQLTVGGTFVGFLLNPIYWTLTTLWLVTELGLIRQLFPSFVYYTAATALVLGNFVFIYVNVAGSMRRGYHGLVKFALFSPVYWSLMSIGAWKGFIQLFTKPFYWEKTVHGLDQHPQG